MPRSKKLKDIDEWTGFLKKVSLFDSFFMAFFVPPLPAVPDLLIQLQSADYFILRLQESAFVS
jgi:hypothetical protein